MAVNEWLRRIALVLSGVFLVAAGLNFVVRWQELESGTVVFAMVSALFAFLALALKPPYQGVK